MNREDLARRRDDWENGFCTDEQFREHCRALAADLEAAWIKRDELFEEADLREAYARIEAYDDAERDVG